MPTATRVIICLLQPCKNVNTTVKPIGMTSVKASSPPSLKEQSRSSFCHGHMHDCTWFLGDKIMFIQNVGTLVNRSTFEVILTSFHDLLFVKNMRFKWQVHLSFTIAVNYHEVVATDALHLSFFFEMHLSLFCFQNSVYSPGSSVKSKKEDVCLGSFCFIQIFMY